MSDIEVLESLSRALSVAVSGRFMAEAHASSVWKKYLRRIGLDEYPITDKKVTLIEIETESKIESKTEPKE